MRKFFILFCPCILLLCLNSTYRAYSAELETYTNSIGMEFVLIPAGEFMMGASNNRYTNNDQSPMHKVIISKPFYLGKYKVTQEQWTAVMGNNPSHFKGDRHPVETVSWFDVQAFIMKLNIKEKHIFYSLPTEAEWEYAAWAENRAEYDTREHDRKIDQFTWYGENSNATTHPVGQKEPNAWGLYDMIGNVSEWVDDWYDGFYYRRVFGHPEQIDPSGPQQGESKSIRGCNFYTERGSLYCRIPERRDGPPEYKSDVVGFRLALYIK